MIVLPLIHSPLDIFHSLPYNSYMSKTTNTDTLITADSLALWREHSLIYPQCPELLDFYISLISTHRVSLQELFTNPTRYFPPAYHGSIPPWGIVYYFWRRSDDSSFLDTLQEVEEEVLSTRQLSDALDAEDLTDHKLASSKYSLLKAHYSNPAKSTSLRNRATQRALSHLSDASIKELIAALTAPSAAASTPSTPSTITTPTPLTVTEADL